MNSYYLQFSSNNYHDGVLVIAKDLDTVTNAYSKHSYYGINGTIFNNQVPMNNTPDNVPDWMEHIVNKAKSENRVCVINK